MLKSTWLNMVLNVNLMTLHILKLDFFHMHWIHYILEVIIIIFVENHQLNVKLSYLKANGYLFNVHHLYTCAIYTCTPIALPSKNVDFSIDLLSSSITWICKLTCFWKNYVRYFNVCVYIVLNHFSLKPRHGLGVIYYNVHAPTYTHRYAVDL